MFTTILNMKNANRAQQMFFFLNTTKDRMIHFHISVAAKRHRDRNNMKTREWQKITGFNLVGRDIL